MIRAARFALATTALTLGFLAGCDTAAPSKTSDKMKDGMKKDDMMKKDDGMKKDDMMKKDDGMKKDDMMKKDDGMKKDEMKK